MDDEGVVSSELRCLSVLVNVRCQGLDRTKQIGAWGVCLGLIFESEP
jgi:hypothetical protein